MDTTTGRIFPSLAAALAAGSKPEDLITGPEKALKRVKLRLRMPARDAGERAKKQRRIQKASRRANRRGR
jgi:hypothetical protein